MADKSPSAGAGGGPGRLRPVPNPGPDASIVGDGNPTGASASDGNFLNVTGTNEAFARSLIMRADFRKNTSEAVRATLDAFVKDDQGLNYTLQVTDPFYSAGFADVRAMDAATSATSLKQNTMTFQATNNRDAWTAFDSKVFEFKGFREISRGYTRVQLDGEQEIENVKGQYPVLVKLKMKKGTKVGVADTDLNSSYLVTQRNKGWTARSGRYEMVNGLKTLVVEADFD